MQAKLRLYVWRLVLLMVGGLVGTAQAGKTLDAIKSRGSIKCGVNTGLAGFAIADSKGQSGLDAGFCKG